LIDERLVNMCKHKIVIGGNAERNLWRDCQA